MGNNALLSKKKRKELNQYGLSNTPYGAVLSVDEAKTAFNNVVPTAQDRIAEGPIYNPMNLPEAEVKKMNALGVSGVGATNIITSGDDDDENGDTNAFYYDDNNIFSFTGEKNKGKKPNADLSKLPTQKQRLAKPDVKILSDKDGNNFEYLGQWNGDLSFLDEIAKNLALPPAGSFLYRKPSGAKFGDYIQMDYYIGLDPDTTDLFIGLKGNLMFKPIGHKFIKANEFSNWTGPFGNAGILGNNTIAPMGQTFGFAPNIGTKSLYNVRAGNTNFGNLSYTNNIKPIGLGAFYNPLPIGNPLNFNAAAKPKTSDPTEETSNSAPGTGFEKVANGVAAIAGGAAAVINAIKSNRQMPVSASNGDMAGYIAAQNAAGGGGFGPGSFGGFGTGGFGEGTGISYDDDGNAVYTNQGGRNGGYPNPNAGSSKTILYVIAGLAVAGLIFYYIKKHKK
ncbi:LPXTG cell wall anchor domain-containing protein [Pedobacter vanadiisoli]|uniref:LPXTG cell wall anchor domain-containing protein n=1 Tax=Pedobacter vanadiisoli TaxID=1761975 RepID=A0ABW5MEB0_9SPHI